MFVDVDKWARVVDAVSCAVAGLVSRGPGQKILEAICQACASYVFEAFHRYRTFAETRRA